MIQLQNCKFLLDSIHKLAYDLPKRNRAPDYELIHFMHYSAKRGLAIACHLSVCPSVTLLEHDHIG